MKISGLPGDLAWLQHHGAAVMTAAGAVLIALVAVAVLLAARRASLASVLRGIAIPLVLIWEAQGVYGVALRLHVPRELAYPVAGVMSAVVLALASYAHKHFGRHGTLGPNGRRMWYVAVFMGGVVAANAGSLTGAGLRVLLPVLSLVLFQAPYLPDEPAGKQEKHGSWRLTPRRLGVSLGLLDPADTDLSTVHAERTIRLLTRHAAGHHRGPNRLRGYHGWRFERLALVADDDMIAEAARRVLRVHTGLASTMPGPPARPAGGATAIAPAPPTAAPTEAPPAIATGEPPAEPPAAPADEPSPVAGAAPTGTPPADGSLAIARVRRKGSAACSDEEIREAIRELRKADPDITKYAIGKKLKGNKGTVGADRAARLLAEVNAERATLSAVK